MPVSFKALPADDRRQGFFIAPYGRMTASQYDFAAPIWTVDTGSDLSPVAM
jgi:hypothetical protein